MPRPHRCDRAGTMYHVTNRGVARRSIFESRGDYRYFLSQVGRAVRRGEFVVLAHVLMQNHYHLIVRSRGGLSIAMQRVQSTHARRFNWRHEREGPLFSQRFFAKAMRQQRYERFAFRYVHENPVLAGLVSVPEQYAWSSAAYERRRRPPLWVDPELLDRYRPTTRPSRAAMEARKDLVDAMLRSRTSEESSGLVETTSAAVLAWLQRNAQLADGVALAEPAVGPATLARGVATVLEQRGALAEETPVPGGQRRPILHLLTAGLLRSAAACNVAEIARRLGWSQPRARRAVAHHRACMEHLEAYAALAADVVSHCLAQLEDPGAVLRP